MTTTSTPVGSQHEAVVDGFTHGGAGVARVDGKAVFVDGALPGERVRFRVTSDGGRFARAVTTDVLDPAPGRVTPPCPVADRCGGCDLQHADRATQVELKARVVREQLERIGGFDTPPVRPGVAVGPDLGYRAHARVHAAGDGRLGFHAGGTTEVVPIATCPVLSPAAQALLTGVGRASGAVEVELRADGCDRSGAPGAVTLTPGPGPLDLPLGAWDLLLAQPDGTTVAMRGDGTLVAEVAGLSFTIPAGGFFQVSTEAAEALVETVLTAAGAVEGALTWDLYAGVGLFSLPLARAGAEVLAVEGTRAAATALDGNATANGLDVEVLQQDVRTFLADRAAAVADDAVDLPDVVVLDPPRTGVGAKAVEHLAALGPARVVLVACDPASLARDAAALAAAGFALRSVQPLDLFPMTHHVEAVALLQR